MISVLVAAYNAEQYICQMIESVQDQTFQNWELIIVDDGSTDQTYALCQKYQCIDKRIHLLKTANKGAVSARNLALKNASGEFIVILDADDVIYENKLEIQYKLLSESDSDVVYGDIDRCDSNLMVVNCDSTYINTKRFSGDVFENIMCGNLFSVHAAMFRRIALREEFLHPTIMPIIADWELWSRLSQYSKFIAHPEVVGAYRMHDFMSARVDNPEFQFLQRENTLNCFKGYSRFANLGRMQKSKIIFAHARFAHEMKLYQSAIKSYIRGIREFPLNIKLYLGMLLSVAGFIRDR